MDMYMCITWRAAHIGKRRYLYINTGNLDCFNVKTLSCLYGQLGVEEKTIFFNTELVTLVRWHLHIEIDSCQ